METRICTWCGNAVEKEGWCVHCTQEFEQREDMTNKSAMERLAEFDRWYARRMNEIEFKFMLQRFNECVGREVKWYELAPPVAGKLRREIQTGVNSHTTIIDAIIALDTLEHSS